MRIFFSRAKTKKASEITEGRFPVDRLPAMTDEKIWKGTGTDVEEVDLPAEFSLEDCTAGDNLVSYDDSTYPFFISEAYTKTHELKMTARDGTLRIKFTIQSYTEGKAVFGRIYRNGGAVGTERTHSASPLTREYSEDIAGWSKADLIQLYIHGESDNNVDSKQLRIYIANPLV